MSQYKGMLVVSLTFYKESGWLSSPQSEGEGQAVL